MKKIFLSILAGALIFFLSAGAMAGEGNAPKSICLNLPGTEVFFNIVTKSGGSMKMSGNQKVKFYTVQGNWSEWELSCPITGSGYMNGNNFHFNFTGLLNADPFAVSLSANVTVDVTQGSATMVFVRVDNGLGISKSNWELESVPCTNVTIPSI